jgi:hypothetical protein
LPDKHSEEKAVAKDDKKAVQKQPNRVQRYYRRRLELKKSPAHSPEATNLTIVVLIVIAAMSAFLVAGFILGLLS